MAYEPKLSDFRIGDKVYDNDGQRSGTITDIRLGGNYNVTIRVDDSMNSSENGTLVDCHYSILAKSF